MDAQLRAKTYPGLDVVRLAAALLVVFYHLGYLWADHKLAVCSPGWVGVDIFFVISGFVIAFSAEGSNVKQFCRRRIARLYPAAFICSTLIVLLRSIYGLRELPVGDFQTYIRSIALFPIGPWLDGVYWTLPVEMTFYLLVGIALWQRWQLPRVALCLGFYSCAFWCLKALNAVFHFVELTAVDNAITGLTLVPFGVEFALGMLLYARMYFWQSIVFLFFGFVAAAARSHGLGNAGTPFQFAPFIWAVAVLLITASVIWNDRLQQLKSRTAGLMTYPLYLIHTTIGVPILRVLPFPIGLIVGALLSLMVAFAELPFERALRDRFRVPRGIQQAALP